VYVIAGLERADTGKFLPYVMGVTRNVLTSPGDETKNSDVEMSIPLDRELTVSLGGVPAAISGKPNQYRVQSYVDLGGEGVIVRRIAGAPLDVITRYTAASEFSFVGQPAFSGTLLDASYGVVAGFYTDGAEAPLSEQRRVGVRQTGDALLLSEFLGIPERVAPAEGASIPKDRLLRFDITGPAPDLIHVEIIGGDGNPAWSLVLPGDARSAPIPDLTGLSELGDIASGEITWEVTGLKVADFVYDHFQYSDLSSRRYTHRAINQFTMRR
jgi:hypothetical protein